MEQQNIDELLETYLGLLDEYTSLRQSLSQLQASVYQGIARANFSGERGMRYGQDHYDERMQAVRRLDVEVDDKQQVTFAIVDAPAEQPEEAEEEFETKTSGENHGDSDQTEETEEVVEAPQKNHKQNTNPLRWFGLFAPMPLRTAQTQSIQVIEQVIPRLVSVNAEMLRIEIEVRRARKRIAKAKAVAGKKGDDATNATETQSQTTPVEAS